MGGPRNGPPYPPTLGGAPAKPWRPSTTRRPQPRLHRIAEFIRTHPLRPENAGMIYMVEMNLLDIARRAEWDAWYVAHQHRLLSIPGFRASQRFESIHPAVSPFVALHEVDSADVLTSPAYRGKAGPNNTGE